MACEDAEHRERSVPGFTMRERTRRVRRHGSKIERVGVARERR